MLFLPSSPPVARGVALLVLATVLSVPRSDLFADGYRCATPRPNIILVVADDLGVEIGCYGDPVASTPHLDAFANQGVRFETGWVAASSCSPSRGVIHTGLYSHQNGLIGLSHRGYSMTREFPSISSVLHENGYRTAIIGKFHIAPESACVWDVKFTDFRICYEERDVRTMVAVAESIMRADGVAPFFIMMSFVDPHVPFLHQSHGLPQDPISADEVEILPWIGIDTEEIREQTAGYYNSIARLDAGFGMLIDAVRAHGHLDNTLIIFIGDHGAPFTRAKTTCYNLALQVPFLVSYPSAHEGGQVRGELVSTADILSTVLDAVGIERPSGLPGRSLMPLLRGEHPDEWRRYLFGEHHAHQQFSWFPRRTIRDERFQLIHNLLPDTENPIRAIDGCAAWEASRDASLNDTLVRKAYDRYLNPPEFELYDLIQDPVMFHDLSDHPEYAEILAQMKKELQTYREQTGDPFLDPGHLAAENKRHAKLRQKHLDRQK